MKNLKHYSLAGIAVILVFAFTGCSDGNEVTDGVTGVTLNEKEIYLPVGEKEILTATVLPANAPDKTVTWSSSNTEVATVEGGEVTGVAEGIVIITATAKNGRTANCLVIAGAGVESVGLNKTAFTTEIGRTVTLAATVLPANALSLNVTWSSSNTAVATVTGGTVRGVGVGTATITVTTMGKKADGEPATATCDVTVRAPITGMVWIEPGTFMMGSPVTEPEGYENEILHQVRLTQGFYMGIYEVTQGEFEEVTGFNPSYFFNEGQSEGYYNEVYYEGGYKDYPVEFITWYDAVEYCNLLSEKEGLTPAYTITDRSPSTGYPIRGADITIEWAANGYRLPTEAEWEYACRAGTTTPFNTGRYTITSGFNGQANFDGTLEPYNGAPAGDFLECPTPVGWYAPNDWGLYDMHGNVYEWCWDWYRSYRRTATGQTETDPKGPEDGLYKVLRGGSWWNTGVEIRSGFRDYDPPGAITGYSPLFGFRVVRSYSETI
jgi:formylglycine-generating enzyme required for sulfatase activity